MRIIFLNAWYAQVGEAFWKFIQDHSQETDVFCLQEVTPGIFEKLSATLKGHNGALSSVSWIKEFKVELGQSIFAKKDLEIVSSGELSLYKQLPDDVGLLQHTKLKNGGKEIFIGNVHGKTLPGNKLDTPTRLKQSQKIISAFANTNQPRIFGGDFNLMPETESIKMVESAGYRNLIKDFDIKNTRNRLSWERFDNVQYFSDYVFVSPGVEIKHFSAPNIEISDHLPLILDFEV